MKELNLLLTAPHVPDLLTEKKKEDDIAKPAAAAPVPGEADDLPSDPEDPRVPPINADVCPGADQKPVYRGLHRQVSCFILLCKVLITEKNGFVTATKLGTTNKIIVAATKNFAAATKRFVDRPNILLL